MKTDVCDDLLKALKALLELAECYEEKIDGEWGDCRTIEQIEKDHELPNEIRMARIAIADAEEDED